MMPISSILPQTALDWLQQDQALLIDVREESEYIAEAILGAYFYPLSSLASSSISSLFPLNKKLIIYCRSGIRSLIACEQIAVDYPQAPALYNLEGGILQWKKEGLKTTLGST